MEETSSHTDWASEEERRREDKEMYFYIKAAIDRGQQVWHTKDSEGDTILMSCSGLGFTDTVRLVVSIPGIKLDERNNEGKTALEIAANKDIKKILLDAEKGIFTRIARKIK